MSILQKIKNKKKLIQIEQTVSESEPTSDIEQSISRFREMTVLDEDAMNLINDAAHDHEGATKRILILGFLRALGYDVDNIHSLSGERTVKVPCGTGSKKKHVDYAIIPVPGENNKDPKTFSPVIVEAKKYNSTTNTDDKWLSFTNNFGLTPIQQIKEYFDNIPSARLAIVTNGVTYLFFANAPEAEINGKHEMAEEAFLTLHLDKEDFSYCKDLDYCSCKSFYPEKASAYIESIRSKAKEKLSTLTISNSIAEAFREDIGCKEYIDSETLGAWISEQLQNK